MPDPNGLLAPAERAAIAGVMKTKVKPPSCPWCGSLSWEVGPFVVISPAIRANGTVDPAGPAVPLVTLMSPCGYIAHFAARLFGVEVRPTAGAPAAPAEPT